MLFVQKKFYIPEAQQTNPQYIFFSNCFWNKEHFSMLFDNLAKVLVLSFIKNWKTFGVPLPLKKACEKTF